MDVFTPQPMHMPTNPARFFSNCHQQRQSPLFSIIPPEIRNKIFDLVLLEQDSTPFSLQAYWYRPDYPAARFIDTALLRTCRLVYIETWNILLRNVTHRRWLGIDERKCPNMLDLGFRALRSCTLRGTEFRPNHVQVFSQMFAAEGLGMRYCMRYLQNVLKPKTLTITFRYTDWFWWESDQPLKMLDWPTRITFPDSVEKLVMEFETRNGKRNELDQIVNDTILKWRIPQLPNVDEGKERMLITTQTKARVHTWIGPDVIGHVGYPHHSQSHNGTTDLDADQMLYYVAVVEWSQHVTGWAEFLL